MSVALIIAYLKQPTSVAGISLLSGDLTAYLSGHVTAATAINVAVTGIVAILLPDNSGKAPTP